MYPTVSIIIPTYNRTETLADAVESCITQDGVQTDVIVVDDGSTDGSVEALTATYPEARIFRQDHRGACVARNRGIQEAKGQFVKFLDSDDKLAPNVLSAQVRYIEQSEADVVYGDFEMFGNLEDTRVGGIPCRITGEVDNPVDALLGDWWCAPFCYMYKRESIDEQRWTEDLECLQDFDFILCFALRGKRFAYTPGIAGYYRIHGGQITNSSAHRYAVNRCKILTRTLENLTCDGKLTSNRKFLLAHGFWTAARVFYRTDKELFHETVAKVYKLAPRFWPELWGTWPVLALTGILGIERTEKILSLRRKILGKNKER